MNSLVNFVFLVILPFMVLRLAATMFLTNFGCSRDKIFVLSPCHYVKNDVIIELNCECYDCGGVKTVFFLLTLYEHCSNNAIASTPGNSLTIAR